MRLALAANERGLFYAIVLFIGIKYPVFSIPFAVAALLFFAPQAVVISSRTVKQQRDANIFFIFHFLLNTLKTKGAKACSYTFKKSMARFATLIVILTNFSLISSIFGKRPA